MKIILKVVNGLEKGKVFHFHDPENFLLGRNAEQEKQTSDDI